MAQWLVKLTGDESDLQTLSKQLHLPSLSVEEKDGIYYLISEEFNSLTDSVDVRDSATELIGLAKALVNIHFNDSLDVEIGGINRLEDDGRITQFLLPPGIPSEEKFGMSTVGTHGDSTDASHQSTFLESEFIKVRRRPSARKALRIYGLRERSWHNLSNIFEAIKSDVGGKITKEGWATKSETDIFTRTANCEEAIGDDARHGDQRVTPPANPMTLSEAQLLIKKILIKYLRSAKDGGETES